jgi:hypothetical protein
LPLSLHLQRQIISCSKQVLPLSAKIEGLVQEIKFEAAVLPGVE